MNRADFEKAAKLSHLSFDDDEQERFIKDMTDILAFADTLCELDTLVLSEVCHVTAVPFEKDEVCQGISESILAQSKKNDGTYIVVPSTL